MDTNLALLRTRLMRDGRVIQKKKKPSSFCRWRGREIQNLPVPKQGMPLRGKWTRKQQ